MLRNISRALTSKQALMADHSSSLTSPSQDRTTRPISSFTASPKFINGFLSKSPSEIETMSPTSILDSKQFHAIANPFGFDKNLSKFPNTFSDNKHYSREKREPKGIGLALLDSLNDEKTDDNFSNPNILFGSKLKIQIPPLSALSLAESPKSPADFGIRTRNSQFFGASSPSGSVNCSTNIKDSPQDSPGCLSMSEMELSEDYTCVISRGPNPRTTHIYDNCILESCSGVGSFSTMRNEFCSLSEKSNSPSENFLSFCYTCKKNLRQGKHIYMYRGEKAFCSRECLGH